LPCCLGLLPNAVSILSLLDRDEKDHILGHHTVYPVAVASWAFCSS
jgi:hypothetical protein